MNGPVKILFVDDERNVLRSLERLFLDEDYEIVTAQSGPEGLEILKNVPNVQIVVSDFRMPEMNGVDFLHKVHQRWPETVRIVLSGYADTAAIVAAINEGQIYKFVPKPWNDDELKVTIGNAIELYRLHRENEELMIRLQHSNEELEQINECLEKKVYDRTQTLEFKNKVLKSSQNILNSLPVGVVGIDMDNIVVYYNNYAGELINFHEQDILGSDWQKVFPPKIVSVIVSRIPEGNFSAKLNYDGHNLCIKGALMRELGQEGLILTFDID